MLLKLVSIQLGCYNSLVLNAIPMTTTKKIFIEYSQKEIRGELKLFTKKNQIHTEKDSNKRNERHKGL